MEGFDGERGKKSMYELGFRTPIILSWPGHVPAGVVRDQLVSAVDLFPTLLDYAQPRAAKPRAAQPRAAALELPPGRPGHSLRPLLEGGADWPRTEVIGAMSKVRMSSKRPADRPAPNYNDREPAYFLRSRDWYYIWREDWGSEELYDVHLDPRQVRDLAAEQPELTRRLRARIEDWKRERLRPFALEPGMRR
jgi:arylsulfatase A-like enzyme